MTRNAPGTMISGTPPSDGPEWVPANPTVSPGKVTATPNGVVAIEYADVLPIATPNVTGDNGITCAGVVPGPAPVCTPTASGVPRVSSRAKSGASCATPT